MRVLHILERMDQGGIESFIMEHYNVLRKKGYVFDFLVHTEDTMYYEGSILNHGGKIYRITPRRKSIKLNRRELTEFYEKNIYKYDAIHQHVSSFSYITPILLADKMKKDENLNTKLIIHIHSSQPEGKIYHRILNIFNDWVIYKKQFSFITCSLDAVKQYRKSNSNFTFFPNGIDMNPFKNLYIDKAIKSENEIRVLTVGRLVDSKNHGFIIKLASKAKFENRNIKFVIVGDGPLYEELKQKVKVEALDNIEFLGNLPKKEVYKQLFNNDVFLLPSLFEGFPVSVVEAQGSGIPVILSKNITHESKINHNVVFLDLEESLSQWLNVIETQVGDRIYNISDNIIFKSEFNIVYSSEKLINLYSQNPKINK